VLNATQVIEKCHKTMQGQFDQWYQNLHARNGVLGNSAAQTHGSTYSSVTTAPMGHDSPAPYANSLSTSMSTLTTMEGPGAGRGRPGADAKAASGAGGGLTAQQYASNMHIADSKSGGDDVNEDILAFYQAKEDLLKRRNAGRNA
jgi:hypothetical protein